MAEKIEKKYLSLGIIAGGIAFLGLIGLAYMYWRDIWRDKLIKEYIKEVEELDAKIKSYADEGKEIDNEVLDHYNKAFALKEEVIKDQGWLINLIKALALLGIVIIGYKIGPKIIDYLIRKYPPRYPNRPLKWKCQIDGAEFPSESLLKDHMRDEHPATTDPTKTRDAYEEYRKLPDWTQDLVATLSGFPDEIKEWSEHPEEIPLPVKIAIITVISVVIVIVIWYSFGLATPVTAGLSRIVILLAV